MTSQHLLDWLMPWLLGALLTILLWIGRNIADMSKSLAIAVTKIDDHERRLQKLEDQRSLTGVRPAG